MDLEIVEPNPFTVFVGPNGSGKSNIFEALEFYLATYPFNYGTDERIRLYGGTENLRSRKTAITDDAFFFIQSDLFSSSMSFSYQTKKRYSQNNNNSLMPNNEYVEEQLYSFSAFLQSSLRIFIGNRDKQKLNYDDDSKLNFSASNLEKVLRRILEDEIEREEIKEWLDLFIPGFENIEIVSSELSGTDTLVMYEKGIKKPFTKDLLSDGTYNILALLTAVYQSDEPQFLCIEEPENGLNPYVIRKLVDFFRAACEEKGHYIWLNTHSNALVECLTPEEVIVVDKIGGETKIKQLKGMNLHGLNMAEVWLSGALGGGTPW